jgi:hypothetical protein
MWLVVGTKLRSGKKCIAHLFSDTLGGWGLSRCGIWFVNDLKEIGSLSDPNLVGLFLPANETHEHCKKCSRTPIHNV